MGKGHLVIHGVMAWNQIKGVSLGRELEGSDTLLGPVSPAPYTFFAVVSAHAVGRAEELQHGLHE